ncbi:MAG: hypothetical protein ABSC15_02965 [Terriglobales bacterium]|jgi:hypothetical protein
MFNFGLKSTVIIFPDPLISGDTWRFSRDVGKYGDGDYIASITFAGGKLKLTANATTSEQSFNWEIPGSQTKTLAPQPYGYVVQVTDQNSNRFTVEQGSTLVKGDITLLANVDALTVLQKMLVEADKQLLRLLSNETSMVQYGGQTYTMHNIQQFYNVRNSLEARVNDEQERLRGNKRSRRILTRFVNR